MSNRNQTKKNRMGLKVGDPVVVTLIGQHDLVDSGEGDGSVALAEKPNARIVIVRGSVVPNPADPCGIPMVALDCDIL
jgi:hypothetical protein